MFHKPICIEELFCEVECVGNVLDALQYESSLEAVIQYYAKALYDRGVCFAMEDLKFVINHEMWLWIERLEAPSFSEGIKKEISNFTPVKDEEVLDDWFMSKREDVQKLLRDKNVEKASDPLTLCRLWGDEYNFRDPEAIQASWRRLGFV